MRFYSIIILSFFLFTSCQQSNKKYNPKSFDLNSDSSNTGSIEESKPLAEDSEDPIYKILEETENIGRKMGNIEPVSVYTARVRLTKKLSESELYNLVLRIRSTNKTKAKGIRYWFWLPGDDETGAAWATATFNPDLQIAVIGKTIESDQSLEKGLQQMKAYEGIWTDNYMIDDVAMRIRKNNRGEYLLEYVSPTNTLAEEFCTKLKRGINNG
jgi:hypothetical protein